MPSTNRLTLRLLATFGAVDLTFKLLTLPVFLLVFGASSTGEHGRLARILLAGMVPSMAILGAVFVTLLRPIERWLDTHDRTDRSPQIIAHAAARLHRLPFWFAALWSGEWFAVYALPVLRPDIGETPAIGLLVAAVTVGALPLAYLLTAWTTNALSEQIAVEARSYGMRVEAPALGLRRQMSMFASCLTLAPSLYLVSITFTVQSTAMPMHDVLLLVAWSLGAIGLYALLSARLFSDALAAPVERMSAIIRTIAHPDEVALGGRVPHLGRDELGNLAEWTHMMIDRLEQTERERATVSASLEALNRTLEERVEERTTRLAQVNASLAREMKTRSQMEIELRQAQKLEAVGRLAAGVAHEINTPVQFVSDSVHFVRDAMNDLTRLVEAYRAALAGSPAAARIADAEEEADLGYLLAHVPKALDRSIDGLQRLSTIVRSMKEFAHPDQKEMSAVDLNHAIQSTLTIARSEYKYVADVDLDLGPLPLVTCHGGDVNQVVLNIVVNAAHAISDRVAGRDTRGTIGVHTHQEGPTVVIAISDTGGGIPKDVQDRIFDPFFTTKEVGRGTGQGLAIARTVIDKHGGELTFVTEMGKGTTFLIRLPIEGRLATSAGAPLRA